MSEEREFAKQVKIEIKDVSFKMDRTGDKVEKVVLEVEKYGIIEDKIDFKVKPIKKIDFSKILTSK